MKMESVLEECWNMMSMVRAEQGHWARDLQWLKLPMQYEVLQVVSQRSGHSFIGQVIEDSHPIYIHLVLLNIEDESEEGSFQ